MEMNSLSLPFPTGENENEHIVLEKLGGSWKVFCTGFLASLRHVRWRSDLATGRGRLAPIPTRLFQNRSFPFLESRSECLIRAA